MSCPDETTTTPASPFSWPRLRLAAIAAVAATNLALWIIPSRVGRLISKDRPVLLGRYSVERMTLLLILIPVSILVIWLLTSNRQNLKPRLFKVTMALVTLLLLLPVADLILRIERTPRYVTTEQVYHRPPNQAHTLTIHDRPETAGAGAAERPGYPSFECRLTTDARGFRNRTARERYDVVCLGDSFVEGSGVSDEQAWAALVEEQTGLAVYNLGMSGSSPMQYLANFNGVGLPMKPRHLVCMLYEGNDFREVKGSELAALAKDAADAPEAVEARREPFSRRLRKYLRSSPFRLNGKRWLIEAFGGVMVAKAAEIPGMSWQPFGWPAGPDMKYYAFKPKYFRSFFMDPEVFLASPAWQAVALSLEQLHALCAEHGIQMTVTYAPTAANVLLPRIATTVPADEFHAYMRLEKGHVPEADRLYAELLASADVIEDALAGFCADRGIAYLPLKAALRAATDRGEQCYFTYDQHWSPAGHRVAAEVIARHLGATAGTVENGPATPPTAPAP